MDARWLMVSYGMVADAGGDGGEAWTCDRQTNRINFIQLVCPSPLLDAVVVARRRSQQQQQ